MGKVKVRVLPRPNGDWKEYHRSNFTFPVNAETELDEEQVTDQMLNDPYLQITTASGKRMKRSKETDPGAVISATDIGDGLSTPPATLGGTSGGMQTNVENPEALDEQARRRAEVGNADADDLGLDEDEEDETPKKKKKSS